MQSQNILPRQREKRSIFVCVYGWLLVMGGALGTIFYGPWFVYCWLASQYGNDDDGPLFANLCTGSAFLASVFGFLGGLVALSRFRSFALLPLTLAAISLMVVTGSWTWYSRYGREWSDLLYPLFWGPLVAGGALFLLGTWMRRQD